ncbi:unnamed protein product, partial [Choristocarpus tenellus]
ALKKDRVAPLAEFVRMYDQLGRADSFRDEYSRARPASAHKRWFAFTSASAPAGGFSMWLPSFLDFVQVWQGLPNAARRVLCLEGFG